MRPGKKKTVKKTVRKTAGKAVKKAGRKTRILIVDDHPMMREGLAHSINQEPDLTVCGEARDAAEALAGIVRHRPDLVVTDISLPGKGGLELIKDLKAMQPGLPVLVLSMHDESLYAERALRAGASGYLTKAEAREKLLLAIRGVLGGQLYVSEKTSARIVGLFSGRPAPGGRALVGQLSDREFEVFQLFGQGLATQAVAERLHLSPKTVETHRLGIKKKLDLGSAAELVAYAARWMAAEAGGAAPGQA